MIIAAMTFMLGCVVTSPVRREEFPAGWNNQLQSQWEGMVKQEESFLTYERMQIPSLPPKYDQANIHAPVESAFAPEDPKEILNQPLAQAAMARMKSKFASKGDADLEAGEILEIYESPINAASSASGVPTDIIANIIYIESKGHPMTANGGLMQIDDIQWGLMKDQNPNLSNRYIPQDNIMAGALDLKFKCAGDIPTTHEGWEAVYRAHYQG